MLPILGNDLLRRSFTNNVRYRLQMGTNDNHQQCYNIRKSSERTYLGMKGATLISTTRSPRTPVTRKSLSTHASASSGLPILTVPHICHMLTPVPRTYFCRVGRVSWLSFSKLGIIFRNSRRLPVSPHRSAQLALQQGGSDP